MLDLECSLFFPCRRKRWSVNETNLDFEVLIHASCRAVVILRPSRDGSSWGRLLCTAMQPTSGGHTVRMAAGFITLFLTQLVWLHHICHGYITMTRVMNETALCGLQSNSVTWLGNFGFLLK